MIRRATLNCADRLLMPLSADTWTAVAKLLNLGGRQARIVELILCGLENKEIAAELGLQLSTVRTYLERIFIKLGVRDRLRLVLRVFAAAQTLHRE